MMVIGMRVLGAWALNPGWDGGKVQCPRGLDVPLVVNHVLRNLGVRVNGFGLRSMIEGLRV